MSINKANVFKYFTCKCCNFWNICKPLVMWMKKNFLLYLIFVLLFIFQTSSFLSRLDESIQQRQDANDSYLNDKLESLVRSLSDIDVLLEELSAFKSSFHDLGMNISWILNPCFMFRCQFYIQFAYLQYVRRTFWSCIFDLFKIVKQ